MIITVASIATAAIVISVAAALKIIFLQVVVKEVGAAEQEVTVVAMMRTTLLRVAVTFYPSPKYWPLQIVAVVTYILLCFLHSRIISASFGRIDLSPMEGSDLIILKIILQQIALLWSIAVQRSSAID